MMEYDFEHYLMAGHGRAYVIAKADPERYRDRIMAACRNDYTYDMQSEGSRAFLTYDLISLYDDPTPFVEAIKESYNDPAADKDWKQICYLTDLLIFFGQRKSVIKKYKQLEKNLYSDELRDMVPLCQPFEYVAIKLIEDSSIKVIWNVANDIGKWFLSRTEDPQRLASQFLWFDGNLEDELGEDGYDALLKYNSDSDGVKEYIRIMSLPHEYGRKDRVKKATAEIVMSWIREDPKIERLDMVGRGLMTLSAEEALKLAEQLCIETDPDIKACIVSVFTSCKYCWPLDAGILIGCGTSGNKRLAEEANSALSLIKDERLHDYATALLKNEYDSDAMSILLNNIRKSDEAFIMSLLEELPVTEENEGEWHGIVSDIGDNGDNPEMPEALLIWAYESTLCSYCRKIVVEKMIKRGMLTDEIKEELKWDANLDISKIVREELNYACADIGDAELLIEIYNSAFYDDFVRYGQCQAYGRSRENMEQSIQDYPKIIAYYQNKAVGVISYKYEGAGKYYIGCLAVIKEEQGRGIGTSLMKHFMSENPDWKEITLVTPKDNERNIRFYTERFGFEITGEEDDGVVTVLLFKLSRNRDKTDM